MGKQAHVVLGASGGIGGAVLDALIAQRAGRIRAVARRPPRGQARPGVEWVAADVRTRDGAARAVRDADVVYHCAQPGYTSWPAEFPPLNDAVLAAVAEVGARLVYADNLYGWAGHPAAWDLPLAATAQGPDQGGLAQDQRAHRGGQADVVIV
jgi:uncharacterized protein YbjT (DUF2867 family)